MTLTTYDVDEAGVALLTDLLGEGEIDDVRRDALLRNAAGNPLFLEETVRMLVQGGDVDPDGDLPVPTSLQALIAARLDQLPADQKRTGQHAAVVGRVFWEGAVASVIASVAVGMLMFHYAVPISTGCVPRGVRC